MVRKFNASLREMGVGATIGILDNVGYYRAGALKSLDDKHYS